MLIFPQRNRRNATPIEIVSWANGTDAEIKAMIDAADAGSITLSNYWSVGDRRTVKLSAMTAGDAFTTAMAAQNVVHVLMDTGSNSWYKDTSNKTVNFVIGQLNCLSKKGRMNTTNTNSGGWSDCAMRTDLNNKYYSALPSTYKSCLKKFKHKEVISSDTNTLITNQDYVTLFAEKEVFGSITKSSSVESSLKQISYYSSSSRRNKYIGASYGSWLERSIYYHATNRNGFCQANYYSGTTSASWTNASILCGISPMLCI